MADLARPNGIGIDRRGNVAWFTAAEASPLAALVEPLTRWWLAHEPTPSGSVVLRFAWPNGGRGFAVYAAVRALGRSGIAELVERCCAMARRFADRLAGHDRVEILNEVVLNQVLVRFRAAEGGDDDAHTRRVVERVQREGTCWSTGTTWHGRAAMRISVSN